jgi:hypothetical protein
MYRLHCPDCERPGALAADRREVQNLADAHNDLLHRGQPVATVRRAWFSLPQLLARR